MPKIPGTSNIQGVQGHHLTKLIQARTSLLIRIAQQFPNK